MMTHIEEVRTRPTTENWQAFLCELLSGHYDGLVEKLGSAEELINVTLRESSLEPDASTAFSYALRDVIAAWQPTKPQHPSNTERILEIVAAFTPPLGFTKILGQLVFSLEWPVPAPLATGTARSLTRKALHALERYFPVPPLDAEEPAFLVYRSLLGSMLSGWAAPHALRRLLELNVLDQPESFMETIVRGHTQETIYELLRMVVGTEQPARLTVLSSLYSTCLALQRHGEFIAVAKGLGCELRHGQQRPVLVTPNEELDVFLSTSDYPTYMKYRYAENRFR